MLEKILITGACGFIGYHLTDRLLNDGFLVYAIDGILKYGRYDTLLKKKRLELLKKHKNSKNLFFKLEKVNYNSLIKSGKVDCIIHLAGISGIERFEKNPYISKKITIEAAEGVLRYAQDLKIPVIYASSSSIYGRISARKFSEDTSDLRPISLYAKTRMDIERMFLDSKVQSIGLRFFTVYGEYGRPDMSYFTFTDRIFKNEDIYLYGRNIKRDFTYIKDVIESLVRIINKRNTIFDKTGGKLILNIGRGDPIKLEEVVSIIARYLAKKANIIYKNEREFDMRYTCADNSLLKDITGFSPNTNIDKGLKNFVKWYRDVFVPKIKG